MPLTASDVHDKQFKLVRQTTGYDMDEVDAFLDEVEFEIGRLGTLLAECQQAQGDSAAAQGDSAELRGEVARLTAELVGTRAELDQAHAQASQAHAQLDEARERIAALEARPEAPGPVALAAPEPEAPTAPSSTLAAARLLELAQRTADEHIAQATRDGEQLVAEARVRAQEALAELDGQRAEVEGRILALRDLEVEMRDRLRGYLENQLRELDALGNEATPQGE